MDDMRNTIDNSLNGCTVKEERRGYVRDNHGTKYRAGSNGLPWTTPGMGIDSTNRDYRILLARRCTK
jgi:hypothetical protein